MPVVRFFHYLSLWLAQTLPRLLPRRWAAQGLIRRFGHDQRPLDEWPIVLACVLQPELPRGWSVDLAFWRPGYLCVQHATTRNPFEVYLARCVIDRS